MGKVCPQFCLKTKLSSVMDAEFLWSHILFDSSFVLGSLGNPDANLRPRSHRTRRCSQMWHAKNATHYCQLECSHSIANSCKQHQRICKQMCVQICLRVLCERGLRLSGGEQILKSEVLTSGGSVFCLTTTAAFSWQQQEKKKTSKQVQDVWILQPQPTA